MELNINGKIMKVVDLSNLIQEKEQHIKTLESVLNSIKNGEYTQITVKGKLGYCDINLCEDNITIVEGIVRKEISNKQIELKELQLELNNYIK